MSIPRRSRLTRKLLNLTSFLIRFIHETRDTYALQYFCLNLAKLCHRSNISHVCDIFDRESDFCLIRHIPLVIFAPKRVYQLCCDINLNKQTKYTFLKLISGSVVGTFPPPEPCLS